LNPVQPEKPKLLAQTTPGNQQPIFGTQYGKWLYRSVRYTSLLIAILDFDKLVIGQGILQVRQTITIPFLMYDLPKLSSVSQQICFVFDAVF
jgi:hypothetical protein